MVEHCHILNMDLSAKATDAENKNKCAYYWKFHSSILVPDLISFLR